MRNILYCLIITAFFLSCTQQYQFLNYEDFRKLGDIRAPDAPVFINDLSSDRFQNKPRPVWKWSTSKDAVISRYSFKDSSVVADWTETKASAFSPENDLTDDDYTLYVQAADLARNWSVSANLTITVDLIPPGPPVISGSAFTANPKPAWDWDSSDDAVSFIAAIDTTGDSKWAYTAA